MAREKNLHSDIPLPYNNAYEMKGYLCFKERPHYSEMNDRQILSNYPDMQLPNNLIVTHKYNCFTFIPLNLFDQFSKLANFYFLFIGLLQMIPSISISDGKPVMYMPLFVVLCISALKDLLEDLKKLEQDNLENNKLVSALDDTQDNKQTKWQDLHVGNIIKVQKDEEIPADIILLHSTEKKGVCFIETKNLDGETNLKRKITPKQLLSNNVVENFKYQKFLHAEYEKPNPYIYKFQGNITADFGNGQQKQKIPLDSENFLLRGCTLKNTKYIYGLVVYTGHDTKIMLNTVKQRPKHSSVEKLMNICIQIIFAIQITATLLTGFYGMQWTKENQDQMPYLGINEKDQLHSFLVKWGTWILIYTNFVPISLIVSLELVKFVQAYLITKDENVYSKKFDIAAKAQCSGVNEELGQVAYIFSDKTGTLTSNVMNFKKLIVRGRGYGDKQTISQAQLNKKYPIVSNVQFYEHEFLEKLKYENNIEIQEIKECLLHLSLCHSVIVNKEGNDYTYSAASPDELALVNFAKLCGVYLQGEDENHIIRINFFNSILQFKILHELEFNSTRKRMSVIVQDCQTQEIFLLCKGADSVIEARKSNNMSQNEMQNTKNLLSKYASDGLRTLLLSKKTLQPLEYQQWEQQYHEACTSLIGRDEKIQQVQEIIETDMDIIGGTAIEDMLQDEVGETIQAITATGIKFWVLTGDKVETAINIGISCKLLTNKMKLIIVDGHFKQEVQKQLNEGVNQIKGNNYNFVSDSALIVTGDALIIIEKEEEMVNKLLQIGEQCNSVIACRVSPKQKQEIVAMVRKANPKQTTLAIGDGANDVNMITEAHVGIGIQGVEGQQAARASDYSIGEFKFLRNLLLFHGRECYRRNTALIGYNFYKNILLVSPQWFYGIFNGFSATPLYDPWLYQFYNITYTNFPIIIFAIFDKQYSEDFLTNQPTLYLKGKQQSLFNKMVFLKWLSIGFWQSFFIGVISFLLMEQTFISEKGYTLFFASTGMISYWISILLANIRLLSFSYSHSIGSISIISLSILSYLFTYWIMSSSVESADVYNTFGHQFSNLAFWLSVIIIAGITFGFDYAAHLRNFYEDKVLVSQNLKQNPKMMQQYQQLNVNSFGSQPSPSQSPKEIELVKY